MEAKPMEPGASPKLKQEKAKKPQQPKEKAEGLEKKEKRSGSKLEEMPYGPKVPKRPKPKEPEQLTKKLSNILKPGVYKFGKGKLPYEEAKEALEKASKEGKKAIYQLAKEAKESKAKVKKNAISKCKRLRKRKPISYYAAELRPKKSPGFEKRQKPRLRKSLTPGTVCIMLVGPHRGKRVVFLKALDSGLCLINGPFRINKCPLRRVNQIYLIATKSSLDISEVKVPGHISDAYFKRKKLRKSRKEGDIFEEKREKYKPSDKRKKDQRIVDRQMCKAIKKRKDNSIFVRYLKSVFELKHGQYPHAMVF